jgi:SAM-dependent MidA family methyltransferase
MNTSSNALTNYLRQEIDKHNGQISFAVVMEAALYHPEFGYYNAEGFDLGRHGDFTTAPEISPLFAKSLARQLQQLFHQTDTKNILELGAGTGRLAMDLLLECEKLCCLPEQYYIYEISPNLRKKQQNFLKSACPTLFPRMIWLDQLPENFTGIMIANEVLDALPVHCFRIEAEEIKERSVIWGKNKFAWKLTALSTEELAEKTSVIRDLYDLYPGYESEINLRLPLFIQSITASLSKGAVILIDYGYGQREYYHPERSHGTLTCFYQHHHHNNPLIHPGLQDITAHVDFTQVIETAHLQQCHLEGYTSQAAFLLGCGLLTIAEQEEKNLSAIDAFHLHQAIKLLTLPTEMGERIKVMVLSKNLPNNKLDLIGFHLQDRRRDL